NELSGCILALLSSPVLRDVCLLLDESLMNTMHTDRLEDGVLTPSYSPGRVILGCRTIQDAHFRAPLVKFLRVSNRLEPANVRIACACVLHKLQERFLRSGRVDVVQDDFSCLCMRPWNRGLPRRIDVGAYRAADRIDT